MFNKPATLKKIAKALNISVSTVSRALHDHPSIGQITKMRVKQKAIELSYEPNQAAIHFQKGKSYTIGVILPELSESFFSAAISGIEDTAYQKGYTVLFAQSHDDEEKEKNLVEKMKNQRVDGLLVSISKKTSTYEHFEMLKKQSIPVVFFDRIPPIKNIHYVNCNIETGTFDAVNFLLKKGHRSIGLLNGTVSLHATSERKEGYIKAMVKNRLKFDPTLVINCDLTEEGTINAMDSLLKNKRKPTAIVTFNDYVALYAIRYARSLNILINDDIDFVSYANLPIINYIDNAPLASVEQFPYLQGQKATEILIDLLNRTNDELDVEQAYYRITVDSRLIINDRMIKYNLADPITNP
ncbi:MAG: LacI family DNA-binding transcriptional regulator [Flavobacterium sp.]|nr:LacI family DNA-binding transcriptional regulator [Pedobacter sp.]